MGVALLDFVTSTFDCVERANGNDVKEALCPAKYGSAAFDALSFIDNELGLANQNMGVTKNGGFFDQTAAAPTAAQASPGAPASSSMGAMFNNIMGSTAAAPAP